MWAMQHPIWPGKTRGIFLTLNSPQLFSDLSMCLSIARQSSASPCVSRSRAERGACEAPQMVLTEAEQWLLYWERTQLSCWGTQGREIRSGIIQSALHSLPGEAPAENGLSILFINCKGTIWVSSVSSPRSCSAVQRHQSKQFSSSVCTTRFYTSSDPKAAARASPHLCPTCEKQAPRGRVSKQLLG